MSVTTKRRSPQRTIDALRNLISEAENARNDLREPELSTWKTKARGVLEAAFGPDTNYSTSFKKVRYTPGLATERTDFNPYRIAGVGKAVGVLEAAIYQLELEMEDETVVATSSSDTYDAGLWKHVRNSFDAEEWSTVAMLVAQYVEHHVREWSDFQDQDPDNPLVGKNLAAKAFAPEGPLRLGRAKSEVEGWRSLAMGFMQALSNVDRHRIQSRDDLKRYAIGVLGTGSLLLTQIRYQHPDVGI